MSLAFVNKKLNIEIESEVTLLNLSGFFVRLVFLLFVLSCGSWESSSGGTLTDLGAFHHPSGVITPIVFNHISFFNSSYSSSIPILHQKL